MMLGDISGFGEGKVWGGRLSHPLLLAKCLSPTTLISSPVPAPGPPHPPLGAGNVLAVVILDILHKLVVDDHVVMCKMSPVNEYIGPHVAKMLAPLVEQGFIEFAYGGKEVGGSCAGGRGEPCGRWGGGV